MIIEHLTVPRADTAVYLIALPEAQRAEALVRAIEVGVFCLQRAVMVQDAEFVRREIERLLRETETRTKAIVPEVHDAITKKFGTRPGQVLAPIAQMVESTEKILKERLEAVRQLLDPANTKSDLSRVLGEVRAMLDVNYTGSIQSVLQESVKKLTAENGELGTFVGRHVEAAIKPLAERVDALGKQLSTDAAVEEALAATAAKGRPYELQVTGLLGEAFSRSGASVEHVGADNQPGDVVITFPPEGFAQQPIRVVVEARDRADAYGHKRIATDVQAAMHKRSAQGAVYVTHTRAGLGVEIGDWAEGRTQSGPYVATTNEQLSIAVRWVVALLRLEAARSAVTSIDIPGVEPQLRRIRNALRRLGTIQSHVTAGHNALAAVSSEGDSLRDEIRDALRQIEDSLRLPVRAEDGVAHESPSQTAS